MIAQVKRLPNQPTGRYDRRHKGTYAVTMAGGQCYIVTLDAHEGHHWHQDPMLELTIGGTSYHRLYPADEAMPDPPTIADVPGGYETLNAFCTFWQQATPEQREDMECGDREIRYDTEEWRGGEWRYGQRRRKGMRKLAKWTPRVPDEEPRIVPASNGLEGGYSRFATRDLIAALKGTKQAVRFGGIIVKPAILRELAKLHAPALEVRAHDGTVQLRTPDDRQRVTLRHGAGDSYAGRNGYEAVVMWAE